MTRFLFPIVLTLVVAAPTAFAENVRSSDPSSSRSLQDSGNSYYFLPRGTSGPKENSIRDYDQCATAGLALGGMLQQTLWSTWVRPVVFTLRRANGSSLVPGGCSVQHADGLIHFEVDIDNQSQGGNFSPICVARTPISPGYEFRPAGIGGCGRQGIDTEEECKTAAMRLGGKLRNGESPVTGTGLATVPCGCSIQTRTGDIHFDSDLSDCQQNGAYYPICKKAEVASRYTYLPTGLPGCPKDLAIKTPEECRNAGLTLGDSLLDTANPVTGSWSHVPCGCSILSKDGSLYFDTDLGNCENWRDFTPVCQKPLTCSEFDRGHRTCTVEFQRKDRCGWSTTFWGDCNNESNRNSCLEACSKVGGDTGGCCSYRAHLASGNNGIDGSTGKHGCLFYPGDAKSLVYNGNADIYGNICSLPKPSPPPSPVPTQKPSTLKPTLGEDHPLPPMRHVPNTYCRSYKTGGCSQGDSFRDAWRQCLNDGTDLCMGVMWNSCTGATSDTTGPGAWKLVKAGQDIGTADRPTATCGGRNQARGHWDVFAQVQHIPNTYCQSYKSGGCSAGRDFFDVWEECDADGPDQCMGVMWNPCESGPTSNTHVPGAWKLMKAGQEVGDANNPTATCGGKNKAWGHWDVFIR